MFIHINYYYSSTTDFRTYGVPEDQRAVLCDVRFAVVYICDGILGALVEISNTSRVVD